MLSAVRSWQVGLAVLTACSWVRWAATGSPKVDENYPGLGVGTGIFLALCVGWGLLLWGWWGLLEEPMPTREARRLAYVGLVFSAPMLPMLSNDVYSLLMYGSLAVRGHDVYVTTSWLPGSPYYPWVGEHWSAKVCVYGPTTLAGTFPAVLVGGAPWWGIAGLHVTWIALAAAAMEFSFRAFPDRPAFHTFVWLNPLTVLEGLGQLHADVLGMAALVAGVALALGNRSVGPKKRPAPKDPARLGAAFLYALAALAKYTCLFAGPFFWLVGAPRWPERARRLATMAALFVALAVLFYAPFWRGAATITEPLRTLGGMNPGGSIVEVVGDLVRVLRGGSVPPANLPPQVAIEVERAAMGPTWAVASLVLRLVFLVVAATQLFGVLRPARRDPILVGPARSPDDEAIALGAGIITVAAITLFSHRFQSWYLMAALPFFGLHCDRAWRRWWLLAVGFSVATEFVHVLPRSATVLPVWSVVTNGGVAVVFLLWFRERLLVLPRPPPHAPRPGPAASARPATTPTEAP